MGMPKVPKPETSRTFRDRIPAAADKSRRPWRGNVWIGSGRRTGHPRESLPNMQREGCSSGRAFDHWMSACAEVRELQNELMHDEEKVLAGRLDANMPALLTKDVQGG